MSTNRENGPADPVIPGAPEQPEHPTAPDNPGPPIPLPPPGVPTPAPHPDPSAPGLSARSRFEGSHAVPPVEPPPVTGETAAASSPSSPSAAAPDGGNPPSAVAYGAAPVYPGNSDQAATDVFNTTSASAQTVDFGSNVTVPYPSASPDGGNQYAGAPYGSPNPSAPANPSATDPYATNPYTSAPSGPPMGLSLASLILGVVGVFLAFAFIGFFASLAAVITGHLAQRRQPEARPYWLTGIITGYVGLAIALLMVLIVAVPLILWLSYGASNGFGY